MSASHYKPLLEGVLEQVGRWWVVLLAAVAGAGVLYAASYAITPTYESSAILSFTSASAGTGGGVNGGALGGVMALAGFGAADVSERAEAIATLESRSLIEDFLKREKVMPVLFGVQWKEGVAKTADGHRVPTYGDGYLYFKGRVLSISEERTSRLIRVATMWREPNQAKQWLSSYIALANARLQERAVAAARSNLAYLNQTMNEAQSVEIKSAIAGLMESEMKSLMLAQGRNDYAFKIIDPPFVADWPSRPNRLLMALLGGFLGFIGVLAWALLRAAGGLPIRKSA